jgi:hypothetical protein
VITLTARRLYPVQLSMKSLDRQVCKLLQQIENLLYHRHHCSNVQ